MNSVNPNIKLKMNKSDGQDEFKTPEKRTKEEEGEQTPEMRLSLNRRISFHPLEDVGDLSFLNQITEENRLDFREYTNQVRGKLKVLEEESIEQTLEVNKEVALFYHQLNNTSGILGNLENLLTNFKNELGEISSQVDMLQEKSMTMNISLTNRKNLEKQLHAFLNSIIISPEIVNSVCNDEIDENFIQKVEKVHAILNNLKNPNIPASDAILELVPEIEKLKFKLCSRLRNFLMSKLQILKKPMTNIQIIQQNVLLKYKGFLVFLRTHNQGIYFEITNYYSELMNKLYLFSFKTYISDIHKVHQEIVVKNDSMIVDEELYRNSPAFYQSSVFGMGEREKILENIEADPIISHISLQKKKKHPLEEIFRSENKMLINAIVTEFIFVLEFFDLKMHQCSYIFNAIFKKSVNYFIDNLKSKLNSSYDPTAIILMIIVNEINKELLNKKEIPILDFYFDKVNMVLWPKLLALLDNHVTAIHKVNLKHLKLNSTAVCVCTKRYVDLVSGLYSIAMSRGHEMLIMRLKKLKDALLQLINQYSEKFTSDKNKLIFLLNNIDYIYTNFSCLQIGEFSDLISIEKQYHSWMEIFTHGILQENFRSLLDIVNSLATFSSKPSTTSHSANTPSHKEGQPIEESKSPFKGELETEADWKPTLNYELLNTVNTAHLENVAQDFSIGYRSKLEELNLNILQCFSNPDNAKEIVGRVLKHLMLNYSTFGEIVKYVHPEFYKELVAQHILFDLKGLSVSLSSNHA